MFAWRPLPLPKGDDAPGPSAGAYLTVPALENAGIRAAFTGRHGGFSSGAFASLNLSYVSGDDPEAVRRNRSRALAAVEAEPEHWTGGEQVHGVGVVEVTTDDRGRGADGAASTIPETDAMWTAAPGIPLAVLVADCVPILLADPERRRVAVVHAGWRGLVGGVVAEAVEALGSDESLSAYVGPSIGPCCYEVGSDVADAARGALDPAVARENGRPRLDLWRGAQVALRRSGVTRVHSALLCTRCEAHRFYSHRAGDAGRQALVAMLATA